MKIQRSSKIYFNKWLTQKKSIHIKDLIDEYSKVVNYFINKYESVIPFKKKFDLLLAVEIQGCIKETRTWLSARLVKNSFAEGYGMVKSARSNATEKKKYVTPVHYGKTIILSETINTQYDSVETKDFDFNVKLGSIGNKMKISIPLRKHKQFNKWDKLGKRSKSIILTNKYIQFSFEIETGEKKIPNNNYIGIDIGMNKLVVTSNNQFYGTELIEKLKQLNLKKQYSKAYYRKKQEIKEYINQILKQLPFKDLSLVVVERLKNVKYKTKFKRLLNKNMRRLISNWNYRQVLDKIQALCEENRVSFRSVDPFYTSQECSNCGHRDKRNRKTQESFVCQSCGHTDNADINASQVILQRFITGTYGSCFQT